MERPSTRRHQIEHLIEQRWRRSPPPGDAARARSSRPNACSTCGFAPHRLLSPLARVHRTCTHHERLPAASETHHLVLCPASDRFDVLDRATPQMAAVHPRRESEACRASERCSCVVHLRQVEYVDGRAACCELFAKYGFGLVACNGTLQCLVPHVLDRSRRRHPRLRRRDRRRDPHITDHDWAREPAWSVRVLHGCPGCIGRGQRSGTDGHELLVVADVAIDHEAAESGGRQPRPS